MKNPVNWFEIAATNLERAKSFYERVLGITLHYLDFPESPMYMFPDDREGPGCSGALVRSEQNKPSTDGTIIYFYCDDVDVEAARVESAGGTLLFPKMAIGEFGFIVQCIDTEGNRFGMHSMK